MGGEIGVINNEKGGSTFWFLLPYTEVENELYDNQISVEQNVNQDFLKGLVVLVIEDDETNRIIVRRMLEKMGCQVDVLTDGQHAVEINKSYDLIFMDMQMPVLDGLAATRCLREKGNTTPIIALTANAMQEDRERCLQAGMDDFLSKPIDLDSLKNMLNRWSPINKQSLSG